MAGAGLGSRGLSGSLGAWLMLSGSATDADAKGEAPHLSPTPALQRWGSVRMRKPLCMGVWVVGWAGPLSCQLSPVTARTTTASGSCETVERLNSISLQMFCPM